MNEQYLDGWLLTRRAVADMTGLGLTDDAVRQALHYPDSKETLERQNGIDGRQERATDHWHGSLRVRLNPEQKRIISVALIEHIPKDEIRSAPRLGKAKHPPRIDSGRRFPVEVRAIPIKPFNLDEYQAEQRAFWERINNADRE